MNLGTNTLDAQFATMVTALAKDGALIKEELTPLDADLLHMGVGASGEAGELLDAIKKATIYRKSLDVDNVIEELGDLEFYMERIRQIIGVSREETLKRNVAKLSKRYSSGKYSNEQAKERADKVVA
ncbi:TPA: nucleoside triphosphate pyrophosphohydrolase family protein [Acinetobacter baumannii]|nr:nucleoside triphosphate pyrophosphohydrolase family protein [Acinetobacter baumannii]